MRPVCAVLCVAATFLVGSPAPALAQRLVGLYSDSMGFLLDLRPTPPLILVADPSPAASAGVRSGDRLLALDGQPIESIPATALLRIDQPAGTTLRMRVRRGEQTIEISVPRGQPRSVPLETLLFPHPQGRVWDAVLDTITSGDVLFAAPELLAPQTVSFASFFKIRTLDRNAGVIICDVFQWGEMRPLRQTQNPTYDQGIRAIAHVPTGGVMALATWNMIRVTPTLRISEREGMTAVRISLAMEAHNTITGWAQLKSKGTVESATFLGVSRLLTQ